MLPAASASESRKNNFDLLRLFAALQVLLFHSAGLLQVDLPPWIDALSVFPGVAIFFFISGYLVSGSLLRTPDLKVYARNRAARIFPGLWACLVFTAVVVTTLGFSLASLPAVTWFMAQMVGLHYTPEFLSAFGIGSYNGSLWTIPVELQFYVVLPLVFWVGRRLGAIKAVSVVGFALAFGLAAASLRSFPDMLSADESLPAKLLRYSFVPHVYLFAFGVLCRLYAVESWGLVRGKFLIWLAVFVGYSWLLGSTGLGNVVELSLLRLLLLGVLALSASYTVPWLSERLLRGYDISYGIYIYHVVVINVLVEAEWPLGSPFAPLIVLSITTMLALFSWMVVERPALAWAKRARGTTRVAATPQKVS